LNFTGNSNDIEKKTVIIMELQRLIQILMERNDFFDRFKEDEMQELLKCCSAESFKDAQFLIKEGTRSSVLYIIISGSVVVTKKGKKVDIVREGECIGEMAAISGDDTSATVEAIGKVNTLKIDSFNINALSPYVQTKLYKNIALLVANRLRKRLNLIQ
jgi:CRP-like cAMP-binding protein